MRSLLPLVVATLAFAFSAAAPRVFAEDEENCPIDKLPAKVTAAVKAKWPKGEMVSASKETEAGKTSYEVKVKNGDVTVEATLTEDGTITEVEAPMAVKDLPKAVADAVEAKYPKSKVEKAIEITAGEKKAYEVVVTTADKKTMELTVGADGKITEEEEAGKEEGGDKGKGEEGMGGGK